MKEQNNKESQDNSSKKMAELNMKLSSLTIKEQAKELSGYDSEFLVAYHSWLCLPSNLLRSEPERVQEDDLLPETIVKALQPVLNRIDTLEEGIVLLYKTTQTSSDEIKKAIQEAIQKPPAPELSREDLLEIKASLEMFNEKIKKAMNEESDKVHDYTTKYYRKNSYEGMTLNNIINSLDNAISNINELLNNMV